MPAHATRDYSLVASGTQSDTCAVCGVSAATVPAWAHTADVRCQLLSDPRALDGDSCTGASVALHDQAQAWAWAVSHKHASLFDVPAHLRAQVYEMVTARVGARVHIPLLHIVIAFADKKYETALQLFDAEVGRLGPHVLPDPAMIMWHAMILQRLGRHRAALQDYDLAHMLRPRNACTLAGRGACKAELGDNVGALADLEHALELNPNNDEARRYRGMVRHTLRVESKRSTDC